MKDIYMQYILWKSLDSGNPVPHILPTASMLAADVLACYCATVLLPIVLLPFVLAYLQLAY